jgi:glucosamine-6-phosphate deaminase
VKPHQLYAAGDQSDPHGTHRICLEAVLRVLNELKGEEWMNDCYVWLYRGIWQDMDVSEIDMAVPLSPGERLKKRKAIFKHTSQKDRPKYPGAISSEFWMVSDQKTKKNAENYDTLGLAEYDSIEGFTRWLVD